MMDRWDFLALFRKDSKIRSTEGAELEGVELEGVELEGV